MKVQRKGTTHVEEVSVLGSQSGDLQIQVGERFVSWSMTPLGEGCFELLSQGSSQVVYVMRDKKGTVWVHDGVGAFAFELPDERSPGRSRSGRDTVVAPTPGRIVAIAVSPGDKVAVGDPVVVLEAMKMEQRLSADVAGTVTEVCVAEQEQVDTDAILVRIKPDEVEEP
jgi:biotin carboxyl carrier protein